MNSNRIPQPFGSLGTRFRLAGLLLVMTAAILAGKFWEDFYIDSLRHDCGSLFRDRLVPATTLFHLSDEFHDKRHTLVAHLSSADAQREPSIDYEMGRLDATIDRLVVEIENTFLVDEESRLLGALRTSLESYRQLERDLLERHRKGEPVAYGGDIQAEFEVVRGELLGLTQVQQDVGEQLDRSLVESAGRMSTLLYFQLGVAFVLGLLASYLAVGLGPDRATRRHRLQKVGEGPD